MESWSFYTVSDTLTTREGSGTCPHGSFGSHRRSCCSPPASSASGPDSPGRPPGQPSTRNGDWPHYTADMKGTRYSPLDQINGSNFNQLEVAWRFKTDNLGPRPEYKLEGTPLAIKGILYTTGGTRRSVVALDGKTGEVIWTHSLREGKRAAVSPRQLSGRGVSVLDRRQRRRPRDLRDDRLSARRAQREDRRHDSDLRQGRRPRSEGRRRVRQGPADRSRDRRDRRPLDAGDRQGRGDHRLGDARRRDRADAQQHQGTGARVRRAHRQAAVDVQHDSAPGRVRQRHVGKGIVGRQRQHRRVDADHRRRGARPRLPAGRDALVRFLRRPPARQQPVRREPRLRRSEDRRAQVALPVRAPSDLELRQLVGAAAARHQRQRQGDQGGRVAEQAGVALRLRSRDRPAGVADRRAAGAGSPTSPARSCRRRSRFPPSRRPTRATTSRCRTI